MTDLLTKTKTGTTLTDFGTVKYDGASDRTAMTATVPGATAYGGTTTDTYDYGQTANPLLNRSQVTNEVTTRNGGATTPFSYDGGIGTGAGNPTTFPGKTFAYNPDNQITSAGYGYDGAGNATTFGATALTFDAENRLTSYGGTTLTAGYTGDNLRAWKQNSAGTRTYFLYDGSSPVCELSSTGAIVTANTWGANGLLSRRSGGVTTFYTFDLSGNAAQTLNSSGAVTLTASVGAFGQRTASGATTDPYSGLGGQWGCYNDAETGLFLMGHRYYASTAGRFLTRDPMGYAGGVNLYAYCGNDPVNESDPSGFCGGPDGGDGMDDARDANPFNLLNPVDAYGMSNDAWSRAGDGTGSVPAALATTALAGLSIYGAGKAVVLGAAGLVVAGARGLAALAADGAASATDATANGVAEVEQEIAYHYSPSSSLAESGINAGSNVTDVPVHTYPDAWKFLDSLKYPNDFAHAYEVDITGLNTDNLGTTRFGPSDIELLENVSADRVTYLGPLPPR